MAVSKIGAADRVGASGPSSQADRTVRAREEQLGPGLPAPAERDPRVLEAAKSWEKQFLHEMVKAMRGNTEIQQFVKPSMAEKIYRDQLDDEYVESWTDKGGIGLQDMIYDQVMEKYFGGSAAGAALKKQGPIKLTDRDVISVQQHPSQQPGQIGITIKTSESEKGQVGQLKMPWDGSLLTKSRLADGRTALVFEHDQGVRSTLVFEGVPSASLDKPLAKGTTVGLLSPEINSFFWNLSTRPANAGTGVASAQPEKPDGP